MEVIYTDVNLLPSPSPHFHAKGLPKLHKQPVQIGSMRFGCVHTDKHLEPNQVESF